MPATPTRPAMRRQRATNRRTANQHVLRQDLASNAVAPCPLLIGNLAVYVRLVCVVIALALFVAGATVVARYSTEMLTRARSTAVTR
jgi:hypothetical protein